MRPGQILAFAFVALSWGTTFMWYKLALRDMEPVTILLYRTVLGAAVLGAVVAWLRPRWRAPLAMWAAGLLAAAAGALLRDARPLALWTLAPLAVLLLMTAKKRSPRRALLSLLTWTTHGAGLIAGLARGSGGPARPVAARGEAHGAPERRAAQGRGA